MNYNQRCTIIREITGEGYLDDEVVDYKREVVPCYKGTLTDREQIGVFGSYRLGAFKLHLQGVHKDFSDIEFDGVKRTIKGIKYPRKSTVVIVE